MPGQVIRDGNLGHGIPPEPHHDLKDNVTLWLEHVDFWFRPGSQSWIFSHEPGEATSLL